MSSGLIQSRITHVLLVVAYFRRHAMPLPLKDPQRYPNGVRQKGEQCHVTDTHGCDLYTT